MNIVAYLVWARFGPLLQSLTIWFLG